MADRSLRRTAAAAALVPFLALVWRFDFVCDDAYISFRYAFNLWRGEGLRFNLGPQAPVEGYSEFLWVLVIAGGMKAGVAPWVLARVLSVVAGAALVYLASGAIVRAAGDRRGAALGGALFVGTLAPLAVWSTSGMGTAPFLLAVFGLHLALFGTRPRPLVAAAAAVCVVLLRADGAYWVAVSGTTGLVLGRARPDLLRAALCASVAGAVVFLAHMGWRYSVYGDWLPNTARVKVGLSGYTVTRGASYLAHFLVTSPGVAVALVLGLAWGRGDKPTLVAALACRWGGTSWPSAASCCRPCRWWRCSSRAARRACRTGVRSPSRGCSRP
jgi:arabinofuranosyltransferase